MALNKKFLRTLELRMDLTNKHADLQQEFKAIINNYGKIPKWQFMLESVRIIDKMELIEEILRKPH